MARSRANAAVEVRSVSVTDRLELTDFATAASYSMLPFVIREPERRWWTDAVFYEVYLRSYADSDGDGIGDLRGLMGRLDHLRGHKDSLDVDALWISPFYPSGGRDGGYDVTAYTSVDPSLGTLDDFDMLVAACHQRGLRVVIDWIPSHTSNLHPWFRESRSARDSEWRDWYTWHDGKDGAPPNNWPSFFPGGSGAWTYDDITGQYYLHSFSRFQPDLNWGNPDVREEMFQTVRFWLDRGVDGLRIDSLPFLGKNPDLTDNIEQTGPFGENNLGWPSVHEYVRELRRAVSEYDEVALIGEANLPSFAQILPYVAQDKLSMAQTFSLVALEWSAQAFRDTLAAYEQSSQGRVWPAWYLNSHDHSRAVTRYDRGGGDGEARARAAAVLLLTLACTPFIYQGEELGLADVQLPKELAHDLANRDSNRTPFPWQAPSLAGEGGGFTTGRPWLPVGEQAEVKNYACEAATPQSLLRLYRRMIRARLASSALTHGSSELLQSPTEVLAYERRSYDQTIIIAVNFSHELQELTLPSRSAPSILLSSYLNDRVMVGPLGLLRLRPDEAVVIEIGGSNGPNGGRS